MTVERTTSSKPEELNQAKTGSIATTSIGRNAILLLICLISNCGLFGELMINFHNIYVLEKQISYLSEFCHCHE